MVRVWLSSFAVMLFGAAGPMCGLTNASKEEDEWDSSTLMD